MAPVTRSASRNARNQSQRAAFVNDGQDRFGQMYVANIRTRTAEGRRSREDQVDHLWHSAYNHAFIRGDTAVPVTFQVEREPYLAQNLGNRSNMAVVNIRNNTMHKVVLFEAKRPVDREGVDPLPNDREWEEVKSQLVRNMCRARASDGAVQGMYGIAAIGTWARAYKLPIGSDQLRVVHLPWNNEETTFHVLDDNMYVERLLKIWADEIRNGRNW